MKFLNKYRFLTLIIILAAAFLIGGCNRKPANGGTTGKKTVGFSQMENDGPWRIAETNSMRDEAAKRGYEIVLTDAQKQGSKQVSDVEDLIARRVDAIFLAPQKFEGLEATLKKAKDAKIPRFSD